MCCKDGNGPHGHGGRQGRGNGRGMGRGMGGCCGEGRGRGMGCSSVAADAIVTGGCVERIKARIARLQERLAEQGEPVQA